MTKIQNACCSEVPANGRMSESIIVLGLDCLVREKSTRYTDLGIQEHDFDKADKSGIST